MHTSTLILCLSVLHALWHIAISRPFILFFSCSMTWSLAQQLVQFPLTPTDTIIGLIIQWIMLMTFITIIPWLMQGAIAVVTIFEIYHISDKRIDITRWILSYGTLVALKYSSQTFCTKFYTQSDSFGWKALPWFWQRSLFLNLHSISEVINETLLNF